MHLKNVKNNTTNVYVFLIFFKLINLVNSYMYKIYRFLLKNEKKQSKLLTIKNKQSLLISLNLIFLASSHIIEVITTNFYNIKMHLLFYVHALQKELNVKIKLTRPKIVFFYKKARYSFLWVATLLPVNSEENIHYNVT